jgi:hypothetical protein
LQHLGAAGRGFFQREAHLAVRRETSEPGASSQGRSGSA